MKRLIAVLLAAVLIVSVLCACGETGNDGSSGGSRIEHATEAEVTEGNDTKPQSNTNGDLADSFDSASDVSYVMIYNPDIYDEKSKTNLTLTTGDLSKWIDTSVSRADGLDSEAAFTKTSQNDLMNINDVDLDVDTESDRAGGLQPTYKANDKHEFYYIPDTSEGTVKEDSFTCMYAGDHCYIWTLPSDNVKEDEAKKIGEEFDKTIYDKDVELFGTPRYADEDGKIHLLFHEITGNTLGYFFMLDLFSSSEISEAEAKKYQLNLDHAILHINSSMLGKGEDDELNATMAHEFQHLINFSDAFYNKDLIFTSTWLNESMSGYAEEAVYPGVIAKQQYDKVYTYSDMVRGGMSLYNFSTDMYDIGAYASVYYFSEYLTKYGGSDMPKRIHQYYREKCTSTTDDAEALQNTVDSSLATKVDGIVSYPSTISFKTKSQEWMSKLTLDFYLSTMKYDDADPEAFKSIDQQGMLYNEVNAAKIEGGGRIVFATKDGKFSIPDDADSNLVYVGFDKDMNQVTVPIVK